MRHLNPLSPDTQRISPRRERVRYSDQQLILDRARLRWRTRRVNRTMGLSSSFRPSADAPVSRLRCHIRCRIVGIPRTRRRTRLDDDRGRDSCRCPHGREWPPCSGRFAAAVGIWSPCRIRGCERRRAPAPRSGRGKAAQRSAASPSQMGRFETQWLAAPKNFAALADLSGQWIDLVHGRRPPRGIVLDMDSSVSPTHGEQEMSVWNGHYGCTCYHPLFVFNQFGDLERCALRVGHVHSADVWDDVLKPVVARYQGRSHASIFERTRPLQCPRSTSFWRRSGSNTRSGYRPTRFCRAGSAICSRAQSDDLRTTCAGSMAILAIRPEPGPSRGGLSPRSSGIPENFIPASASS